MKRKKIILTKLVPATEPDYVFSINYWRQIGVQGKFAAAWEMACDFKNWNKKHVTQQKLQKDYKISKSRKS